jgi:predicted kinase
MLSDDATNQTIHAHVFATARYLLRQRLAIRQPITYVDATHLTRAERRPYIEIAEWYGCDIEAIFFDIPLEECLRRNALRERIVPSDAIRAMAAKLQIPELAEGFTRVTHELS